MHMWSITCRNVVLYMFPLPWGLASNVQWSQSLCLACTTGDDNKDEFDVSSLPLVCIEFELCVFYCLVNRWCTMPCYSKKSYFSNQQSNYMFLSCNAGIPTLGLRKKSWRLIAKLVEEAIALFEFILLGNLGAGLTFFLSFKYLLLFRYFFCRLTS